LPLPVKSALAKLGDDIRSARIRRRISTTVMAERAFISRTTLLKVKHGDAGVSLGIYADRAVHPRHDRSAGGTGGCAL
jgi:phage gp37-like protein